MTVVFWLHSLWRWAVLAIALAAVAKALIGWLGKQPWGSVDDRLGLLYTTAFDIQLLLGLIVYIGSLMSLRTVIWYGGSVALLSMEHVLAMVIALVIVHGVRSRSKKGISAAVQHRTAAIGFAISLLLVALSIPTWTVSAQL